MRNCCTSSGRCGAARYAEHVATTTVLVFTSGACCSQAALPLFCLYGQVLLPRDLDRLKKTGSLDGKLPV